MELSITMDSPKIFLGIMDAISFLVDEIEMTVNGNGAIMEAIDDSRVAMMIVRLKSSAFGNYSFQGQGEFKVGINVSDMTKMLKRGKASESLEITMDDVKGSSITLKMTSPKSTRTFKLRKKIMETMENEDDDGNDVNLVAELEENIANSVKASFSMDCNMLDDFVKDALIISDLITVTITRETITFSAMDDAGELEIELDPEDATEDGGFWDINVDEDSGSIYSLNYLQSLMKINPIIDHFVLSMGKNTPILIRGNFDGIEDESGITYILAPRKDDNEDEDDWDDDDLDENLDELGNDDEN